MFLKAYRRQAKNEHISTPWIVKLATPSIKLQVWYQSTDLYLNVSKTSLIWLLRQSGLHASMPKAARHCQGSIAPNQNDIWLFR